MKASLPLLSLASAALAEIEVKVDQFSNLVARDSLAMKPGPLAGTEMTPKLALHRRQSYCDAGEFLCPNGIWCAPDGGVCCSDYGACYAGEACCGDGCIPDDAECCSNGDYCPAGNMCVLETSQLTGSQRMVCCTDLQCTAYVEEDGATMTLSPTGDGSGGGATTTAPPTTKTTTTNVVTAMETYQVTFTWTYYFYYWTYIEYSLVTSSLTTSRTTFTIMATDDAAATASVDEIEATIEFDMPAEQSSLSALAEETTFGPADETTTADDGDSGSSPTGGLGGFGDDSSTTTTSTGDSSETSFTTGGDGGNFAPSVWVDKLMIAAGMLAAFGAGALLL